MYEFMLATCGTLVMNDVADPRVGAISLCQKQKFLGTAVDSCVMPVSCRIASFLGRVKSGWSVKSSTSVVLVSVCVCIPLRVLCRLPLEMLLAGAPITSRHILLAIRIAGVLF